jgi:UDP:flavonoid glycosyltransferase YjiC (YdhE family)
VRKTHVAFIVESAHGHVNPILGIVSELVQRGCRVTCAVRKYFVPRVVESGAEPVVYEPLDYRVRFIPKAQACIADTAAVKRLWKEFEQEELEDALPQLEGLYGEDRPDLIVYDLRNLAGKALAAKWGIPTIEHAPAFIESNELNQLGRPYDETLVIASIPRALQPHADDLDERFHFVGPIYNSRRFFEPWRTDASGGPAILVSATTAELQPEFFRTAIRALESLECRVVLSIGDEIEPDSFSPLPPRFEINRSSSHLEILKHVSLFVYQGGLGSTLEAFYCGVPALAIPASPIHDQVALRVAELGLGLRLESSATAADLRGAAVQLLHDSKIRKRVEEMQRTLRETNGAKLAGDLVLGNRGPYCNGAS